MNNGWIKIYRELLNKPIWKQSTPAQRSVLIAILLLANHEENEWEWKGINFKVNPGQFVTSLESLRKASGSGISTKNVRTALVRFEKLDFLAMKTAKTGRIITILNWTKYQPFKEEGRQSKRQRGGKGVATNKNERMKEDTFIGDKIPKCPHQSILDLYHRVLPELPRIIIWSEERQATLRARWREDPKRQLLDWWERFFGYIRESDFLIGRVPPAPGRKQFRPNLDWITTKSHFIDIIEGKYHG